LYTNYDSYLTLVKESGIDYIDFNSYFIANKQKSKYLLEPKYGTHWSMYGAALTGDSLVNYIEKARHIAMPKAIWKNITISNGSMFDIDMEEGMNLIFRLPGPKMAYPDVTFEKDSTAMRPNVLIVGDSYYWGWFAAHDIIHGFSKSSDFWYYDGKLQHKPISKDELKNELMKQDVFIILATAHNWANIGWGFIEDTYNLYKGEPKPAKKGIEYVKELNDTRTGILANKEWLKQIEEQAKNGHISLDSAVTLNAIWVITHKVTNGKR